MSTSKALPYKIIFLDNIIKEIKKPSLKSIKQAYQEHRKQMKINSEAYFEPRVSGDEGKE